MVAKDHVVHTHRGRDDDQTSNERVSVVPFLNVQAAFSELRVEISDAIIRVCDSGQYIGGAEVQAFEDEYAAYCGVKHCVGVGNGLDGLVLLLRAADIGPGDEVIVPAHTFIATWLAVTEVGALPVAADIESDGFNIDAVDVARKVTPQTRAILPVHLYGCPADMRPLKTIADQHDLWLFEDAAQAQGARYDGRRAGSLADGAAWSFYPGKNLGALGDAGAVTTDNDELAASVRTLGNYGAKRKYHHDVAGVNSRLDPMQAAVLRVKLARLEAWNEQRRAVAARYMQNVTAKGVRLPHRMQATTSASGVSQSAVWHVFPVLSEHRDALSARLERAGVATLIHYPVLPAASGAYARPGSHRSEGKAPHSLRVADEELSLPIGPHLTSAQVDEVIAALNQAS